MLKIAVMVANGSEEIETIVPIDLWRRSGAIVDLITVETKKINILQNGLKVTADKTLDTVNLSQYGAIYLPGGAGHLIFKTSKKLTDNLVKFHSEGKPIMAICAATSILGELGLLKKTKATGYPGTNDSYIETYQKTNIVVHNKVLTANGPGSAYEFAIRVIDELINKAKATEIAKATLFIK